MSTASTSRQYALLRESKFMLRERAPIIWAIAILCISSLSLWFGIEDVKNQNKTIEHLIASDTDDRLAQQKKVKDWGSAAYYSFHLTYDRPSDFAFAAMGQRDSLPWKHRVRMLALEGQIYELDASHPVVALVGRLDFSFLAVFIMPLALIMLLHGVRSDERSARRFELLEATAQSAASLWAMRLGVRGGLIYIALILPLVIAGVITGAALTTIIYAGLILLIYSIFWVAVIYWFAARKQASATILMNLLGIWLVISIIIPTGGRIFINKIISVPAGAEILLLQRETVNDAWDLPREKTLTPFFERYPQWPDYQKAEGGFEWAWYYAFQQVGDQKAEPLTQAYRNGRLARDELAGWLSVLSPPALLERSLQALARTDMQSAIRYEDSVRTFHEELKGFYYPKFYQNIEFDKTALKSMPTYQPK